MDKVSTTDCNSKKLTGDGSAEEISTVMIYSIGLTLGLTVTDIDMMTAGEIIDLAYYKANKMDEAQEQKQTKSSRTATQADYDSF